jgi:hypothetical protein
MSFESNKSESSVSVRQKSDKDIKNENYQIVYENYWNHARHVEIERLSFIAGTVVMIAGAINVLGKNVVDEYKLLICLGMAVFMVFGIFILYSLRAPFLRFIKIANCVAEQELKIDAKYLNLKSSKGIRFSYVLMIFYAFTGSIFAASAIYFMLELKVIAVKSPYLLLFIVWLVFFVFLLWIGNLLHDKATRDSKCLV